MPKIIYTRPDKVKHYKKQLEFIDDPKRFSIIEATTKAGKTTGCLVWILEEALKGKKGDNCWWVAPISATAEIAFTRLRRYIDNRDIIITNEQKKNIILPNGVTIWFKSGDEPDSLYGEDVIAVVIDEGTRMKEAAWFAIRTTLSATNGRAKIIGNVKGINNWAYEIARKVEEDQLRDVKLMPEWSYYKLTCEDAVAAGLIKQSDVDEARNTLPNGVFMELYYAIPDKNSSDRFCYSFDPKEHTGKCPAVKRLYPVYLSFDFNRNPICCSVIQDYGGVIYVLQTIKLQNSNIYRLCEYIKTAYPNCLYIVTGDASGSSGSAMVKDNLNYYRIIQRELNVSGPSIRVPSTNPSIEDNQVLVNAIFEHHKVTIDTDKAQGLIFDCKFVEMGPDGKIKKGDRNDPKQQADAMDTFRYWLNQFKKDILLRYK